MAGLSRNRAGCVRWYHSVNPRLQRRFIFAALACWARIADVGFSLIRAMEARGRLNVWCAIVSDTTDNVSSANNFIRAGYRLFIPAHP